MASRYKRAVLTADDRTRSVSRLPTILLVTDRNLRLTTVMGPPGFSKRLSDAQSRGDTADLLPWADRRRVADTLRGALRGNNRRFSWRLGETQFDGNVMPLCDDAGEITGTIVVGVDAAELAGAQTELFELRQFLSTHDTLTQLLNRHVLIELLDRYASEDSSPATLLVLDLDRFSQINEIAGQAVVDELLRTVAERLRFVERHGHFVARLGADEFACLLVNLTDATEADRTIESVRQRLAVPYVIEQNEYLMRTTIGIASHPHDGTGAQLLQNAGIAMLSAKAGRKGAIARYSPMLERNLSARSRIERDLANAVERSEFAMHYQPLIDAATGTVTAVEALLRWQHPDLGLLGPDVFLNVAEESDVVVSIGRWVLEQACRDAKILSSAVGRNLRLNVNVSPRHVQSSALIADVASALDLSSWHAAHLQLEVTEQVLIEDIPSAVSTLERVRDTGVSIAIDDFGTGYNTLSYLKSYPVSCIKIDRAFVKDAEEDDYSRAICLSVQALAESLKMNVIGEGVETSGQADFLRGIGCQELQGYHFGYPLALDEFIAAHGEDPRRLSEVQRV